MAASVWSKVLATQQRRLPYAAFVCAIAVEAWIFYGALPPVVTSIWVTPLGWLHGVPRPLAVALAAVCAAWLWPPMLLNPSVARFGAFAAGVLIGVATIVASTALALLGYIAFELTQPHANVLMAFIAFPMLLVTSAFTSQAGISLLMAGLAGGLAAAFSEATGFD